MFKFDVEQIAPNALAYTALLITKQSVKQMAGQVCTIRVQDFDYEALADFAEAGARYSLDPPVTEARGSNYKGMHNGSLSPSLKASRRKRKSHAERRAQIVSRSMGGGAGKSR